MTYTFPLTITEVPHRGPRHTWTLENEAHLAKVIDHACARSNYDDWQTQQGLLEGIEGADGEFTIYDSGAYTLDAYLDWLRHDLSQLIVEKADILAA